MAPRNHVTGPALSLTWRRRRTKPVAAPLVVGPAPASKLLLWTLDRAQATMSRRVRSVQGCLDPCESLLRQWVDPENIVPSGRSALREDEAHIASPLEREEIEAVGLACQKAAQPNVEAFLVPFDGPANGRVDHEGRLPALADLFNGIETQHC